MATQLWLPRSAEASPRRPECALWGPISNECPLSISSLLLLIAWLTQAFLTLSAELTTSSWEMQSDFVHDCFEVFIFSHPLTYAICKGMLCTCKLSLAPHCLQVMLTQTIQTPNQIPNCFSNFNSDPPTSKTLPTTPATPHSH